MTVAEANCSLAPGSAYHVGVTTRHPDYSGMTTNERLHAAGLLAAWDMAVKLRNRKRMIELLAQVDLGEQAASIADTVLADPKRYGF